MFEEPPNIRRPAGDEYFVEKKLSRGGFLEEVKVVAVREERVDECDGVEVPLRKSRNYSVFDAKEGELGSDEV